MLLEARVLTENSVMIGIEWNYTETHPPNHLHKHTRARARVKSQYQDICCEIIFVPINMSICLQIAFK